MEMARHKSLTVNNLYVDPASKVKAKSHKAMHYQPKGERLQFYVLIETLSSHIFFFLVAEEKGEGRKIVT